MFPFEPTHGLLIAVRVSGLLAIAPGLSRRTIPVRFRVAMVLVLTLLLAPSQSGYVVPGDLFQMLRLGIRELCIGLALGIAVRTLVFGAQWAGQLVGNAVGLGAGDAAGVEGDSNGAPLGRLLELTALSVYFAVGGQRQLMAALLESYSFFPLGAAELPAELWQGLITVLTHGAAWALRIAAPALVAIFSATLATGLISRALPQLEIVSWTASANTLVALAVLSLSLGSIGVLFPAELETTWEALRAGWRPVTP